MSQAEVSVSEAPSSFEVLQPESGQTWRLTLSGGRLRLEPPAGAGGEVVELTRADRPARFELLDTFVLRRHLLLKREGRRVRFPLSPEVFARVSAWAGPPTQAELNRAIATRLRLSVAVGIVLLLVSLTRVGPGDRGSWSPMWLVVAAGVLLVVCGLAAQFHRRRGYFVVDGIGYALLGAQLVGRLAYGWTWGSAAVLTWAGLMILTAVAHFRRYRGTVDSE